MALWGWFGVRGICDCCGCELYRDSFDRPFGLGLFHQDSPSWTIENNTLTELGSGGSVSLPISMPRALIIDFDMVDVQDNAGFSLNVLGSPDGDALSATFLAHTTIDSSGSVNGTSLNLNGLPLTVVAGSTLHFRFCWYGHNMATMFVSPLGWQGVGWANIPSVVSRLTITNSSPLVGGVRQKLHIDNFVLQKNYWADTRCLDCVCSCQGWSVKPTLVATIHKPDCPELDGLEFILTRPDWSPTTWQGKQEPACHEYLANLPKNLYMQIGCAVPYFQLNITDDPGYSGGITGALRGATASCNPFYGIWDFSEPEALYLSGICCQRPPALNDAPFTVEVVEA